MLKGGQNKSDEVESNIRKREEDSRMMKQLEDIKILNSKMRDASPNYKRDL